MMPPSSDDFLAKGEEYAKVRQDAFASYSQAANLVRRRLQELVEGDQRGEIPGTMARLERGLVAAERLKDLTVLELRHADDNWRDWKEEVARRGEEERRHHEEERLTRQEKTTTSATWAAWGAFLAALVSAFVAVWQVLGPARHP